VLKQTKWRVGLSEVEGILRNAWCSDELLTDLAAKDNLACLRLACEARTANRGSFNYSKVAAAAGEDFVSHFPSDIVYLYASFALYVYVGFHICLCVHGHPGVSICVCAVHVCIRFWGPICMSTSHFHDGPFSPQEFSGNLCAHEFQVSLDFSFQTACHSHLGGALKYLAPRGGLLSCLGNCSPACT
jgi:hypothetical protein